MTCDLQTATLFTMETHHGALTVLLGSVVMTVLGILRSILTAKVARRGVYVAREYFGHS